MGLKPTLTTLFKIAIHFCDLKMLHITIMSLCVDWTFCVAANKNRRIDLRTNYSQQVAMQDALGLYTF